MMQVYLWQFRNLSVHDAQARFCNTLSAQKKKYEDAWGRTVSVRFTLKNGTLIGLLYSDFGIKTYSPWNETSKHGIVWTGCCETHLGNSLDDSAVANIVDTIENHPCQLLNWDGRYSLVSWNLERHACHLTMGAVEAPTMWTTQGPLGWAAGSRAIPLLDCVGKQRALSENAAALFAAYGYLISNASLLDGVTRINIGEQVCITENGNPAISTYVSASEIIGAPVTSKDRDDVVEATADAIARRVECQLRYSSCPRVLITGGRDSRLITAAAKHVGYSGATYTGGDEKSKDFLIGSQVSHALGLRHISAGERSNIDDVKANLAKFFLWSELSEGIETLRHALAARDFFNDSSPPLRMEFEQVFHGLGGEIARGYYYPKDISPLALDTNNPVISHNAILGLAHPKVRLDRCALNTLMETISIVDAELIDLEPTVSQWLDWWYWKSRCLHWGADMTSVQSSAHWRWTPLMNLQFIRATWKSSLLEKVNSKFVQDMTVYLEPCLAKIPYDKTEQLSKPLSPAKRYMTLIRRLARNRLLAMSPIGRKTRDSKMADFWNAIFFDDSKGDWQSYIDTRELRLTISRQPNSSLLWNMATVEMFRKAIE